MSNLDFTLPAGGERFLVPVGFARKLVTTHVILYHVLVEYIHALLLWYGLYCLIDLWLQSPWVSGEQRSSPDVVQFQEQHDDSFQPYSSALVTQKL
jgi:hypothetical protein